MPLDFTDDKWISVKVMAWCRQVLVQYNECLVSIVETDGLVL